MLFYFRLCSSTVGGSPTVRVLQLSKSFATLVHTAPCCPTMSSLQRCFGHPTYLTPFICHVVLLMVHLLSFIRAMCSAHFHFALIMYSVTLVLYLMMVLRIRSFSLAFSIFLLIARWLVSSFFDAFARDHVWHP